MKFKSELIDKNQNSRLKSKDYLFITLPVKEDKEELHGIIMGDQIMDFQNLFKELTEIEIYKLFRGYIKDKIMAVQVLKEPREYSKHVDKVFEEENRLIGIYSVESKIPSMDMYFSPNLAALKKELINFSGSR